MRLRNVEQALVQINRLLLQRGKRMDVGFNRVHAEICELRSEVQALRGELVTLCEELTDDIARLEESVGV